MAASANPSGDNNNNQNEGGGGGVTVSNGNGIPVPDNYYSSALGPTIAALKHDPGITLDWSPDQDALMQELLIKYASEPIITKYAKIAVQLNDKTARDVVLRLNWINVNKKENGKRRRDDHNSSRKNKEKKEKVADPSAKSSTHLTNRSNGPSYAQTAVSMDSDDGISYKAIGGATGQLLEQNAQAMEQISANFGTFRVNLAYNLIHDNINLFCQARNNILSILNDLNDLPDIMKQMPPLPVKLNEELATNLLPPPSLHKKP